MPTDSELPEPTEAPLPAQPSGPPPMATWKDKLPPLALGTGAGVLYGLSAFLAMREANALPTAAFVVLVPTVIGALPLLFQDPQQIRNFTHTLLAPWLALAATLALLPAVFGEGMLCLFILGLPFIALSFLVPLLVWFVQALRLRSRRRRALAAAVAMLLPFAWLPVETRWLVTSTEGQVPTEVTVAAPPDAVWRLLGRVEPITQAEFQPGWLHRLGVPTPVEATLDRLAVGGRRTGHFSDGLQFDEVVTEVEPLVRMAFSVDVDPRRLRPGSAQRHAFELGYFRYLDATYALQPLAAGGTQLRLTSRYRVRTGVNAYGRLWAEAVTADFQERVLAVLKARAERAVPVPRLRLAGTAGPPRW